MDMLVNNHPIQSSSLVDDPLQWAFHTGVRLLEAGKASLLLRHTNDPVLIVAASIGIDPAIIASIRVPIGEAVAGLVAQRGILFFGSFDETTFISAPVVTDRGVEGVLNVTNRQGGRQYGDEDVQGATVVADHIARLLQYRRHAGLDVASGLPSRKVFEDMLERELARSRRAGTPFAIAFVDMEYRGDAQETPGHARGDEVMRRVGEALQRSLRRYDFASRYSNDRLALIFSGPSDGDVSIARRITQVVLGIAGELDIDVVPRIGVAYCPDDGTTAEQLLARAHADVRPSARSRSLSP